MRLREDSSSWRASGLKRKLELIPNESSYRSHKDTKKWCKGKLGVRHDYYLIKVGHWNFHLGWRKDKYESVSLHFKCINCGRELYDSLSR